MPFNLALDLPDWAADRITTHVDIRFDWKDRLKILFGFMVTVTVRVTCENQPGRLDSASDVRVWTPGNTGPYVHTPEASA